MQYMHECLLSMKHKYQLWKTKCSITIIYFQYHPEWKLYKRYIDEGITGTSVNKRQSFLENDKKSKNGHLISLLPESFSFLPEILLIRYNRQER